MVALVTQAFITALSVFVYLRAHYEHQTPYLQEAFKKVNEAIIDIVRVAYLVSFAVLFIIFNLLRETLKHHARDRTAPNHCLLAIDC